MLQSMGLQGVGDGLATEQQQWYILILDSALQLYGFFPKDFLGYSRLFTFSD